MDTALIRALQIKAWVKVKTTGELGQILIITPRGDGQDWYMVDVEGNGRQYTADQIMPCAPPNDKPKVNFYCEVL